MLFYFYTVICAFKNKINNQKYNLSDGEKLWTSAAFLISNFSCYPLISLKEIRLYAIIIMGYCTKKSISGFSLHRFYNTEIVDFIPTLYNINCTDSKNHNIRK